MGLEPFHFCSTCGLVAALSRPVEEAQRQASVWAEGKSCPLEAHRIAPCVPNSPGAPAGRAARIDGRSGPHGRDDVDHGPREMRDSMADSARGVTPPEPDSHGSPCPRRATTVRTSMARLVGPREPKNRHRVPIASIERGSSRPRQAEVDRPSPRRDAEDLLLRPAIPRGQLVNLLHHPPCPGVQFNPEH